MFDRGAGVEQLREAAAAVALLDRSVSDTSRVDRIRVLEDLKAACAAAQARDAADLDASRRADEASRGVPGPERGRGVGAEVALARRASPHRGGRYLGMARALVHELPCTLAALSDGVLDEWRATLLVRETAVLTVDDRRAVDQELAGSPQALARLAGLGDRALVARARQVGYRLDAAAVAERSRRAVTERRVTLRPAPDTMAYLTALLPVREAVTAYVALDRAAEQARNAGDRRGRGQLMADTLGEALAATAPSATVTWAAADSGRAVGSTGRVSGAGQVPGAVQAPGAAQAPGAVPPRGRPPLPGVALPGVALRLVMTDRALLARPGEPGRDEPAHLEGYGTVGAGWARELVADAVDEGVGVWVRRLLCDPVGALTSSDSRARLAPAGLADLVRTRDLGTCRTPWCDAPARHVDHVVPHDRGRATSEQNGQGLCVACNHAKELPGWQARTLARTKADGRSVHSGQSLHAVGPLHTGRTPHTLSTLHTVRTTTPTGHSYDSTAPPLPGAGPSRSGGPSVPDVHRPAPRDRPVDRASPLEHLLRHDLALAAA